MPITLMVFFAPPDVIKFAMKHFLHRDADGKIRLTESFTMDEQISLYSELFDRLIALESSSKAAADIYKMITGELRQELAGLRDRLVAQETKNYEQMEILLDLGARIQGLQTGSSVNDNAIMASLEQLKGRLGGLEATISSPFRIPVAGGSAVVGEGNIVQTVATLARQQEVDRGATDSRLLMLEAKACTNIDLLSEIDALRMQLRDTNSRMATEILELRIHLDGAILKLTGGTDKVAMQRPVFPVGGSPPEAKKK